MHTIYRDVRTALIMLLALTVLTGLVYPLAVTGLAQGLFERQANGSLVEQDGVVVGSSLVGQAFDGPQYFHPRPSAAGEGYDAAASSGANLGPSSKALVDRVTADVEKIRSENGLPSDSMVPVDAVTASGSGLDPHISPAYAELQVARVAGARGMSEEAVRALVERYTDGGILGIVGEPRVNVLLLNLALDAAQRSAGQ